MRVLLSILFFYSSLTISAPAPDTGRVELDSLTSRGRMDWDAYSEDFIISESAQIENVSPAEMLQKLKNQQAPTILPVKGSYGTVGASSGDMKAEQLRIPTEVLTGDQLVGLNACTTQKCSIKLNELNETTKILNFSDRAKGFEDLVLRRVKNYLEHHQLLGYEGRDNNIPYVRKSMTLVPFLKGRYPKAFAFLYGSFWKGETSSLVPFNSYLRSELIHIPSRTMQAVYRVSENLEFRENGYLNVEFHLYTNHYFDSSMRIFEILDWPGDAKKCVYIVTDVIELDELKKSALIRTLFRRPMQDAITLMRNTEMKELE